MIVNVVGTEGDHADLRRPSRPIDNDRTGMGARVGSLPHPRLAMTAFGVPGHGYVDGRVCANCTFLHQVIHRVNGQKWFCLVTANLKILGIFARIFDRLSRSLLS
jgi:hypothetical protein